MRYRVRLIQRGSQRWYCMHDCLPTRPDASGGTLGRQNNSQVHEAPVTRTRSLQKCGGTAGEMVGHDLVQSSDSHCVRHQPSPLTMYRT